MTNPPKSFKEKKTFAQRVKDVQKVREKYPNKIPIIVERFKKEKQLPLLSRSKFLVPDHVPVGYIITQIRRMLNLNPTQAVFLLVNQRSMASHSMTMLQLYNQEKDPDGFLYIVYASQETFGWKELISLILSLKFLLFIFFWHYSIDVNFKLREICIFMTFIVVSNIGIIWLIYRYVLYNIIVKFI